MKHALLVASTTKNINIGDYIQGLAAAQFINNIDVFIERERISEYKGEEVKMIMNGWFMHEPEYWPPSNKIKPLFVAFHINSTAKRVLLSKKSIEYLKKYEPIGCRDMGTTKMLKDRGIDAYFSGCLTLTLGRNYKSNCRDGSVYFVDPHFEIEHNFFILLKYIIHLLFNFSIISIISLKKYKSYSIKNLIKSSAFFSTYRKYFDKNLLVKANYISQENSELKDTYNTHEQRNTYAAELLDKYSKASFVVTSRIHCALPCLSMDTPVFYVENIEQSEAGSCRLEGLRELFHRFEYNNGKLVKLFDNNTKKINLNSVFENKPDYKILADNLIIKCEAFTKKN